MEEPGAAVHAVLVGRGETVASAESLTGGGLAELLSATPGASASYLGGVVGYATSVKESVLGVPKELVASYGVVSAECAEAMAVGVRRLTDATWGVSTTGVAGPSEQEGKPVGTVYVGVAGPSLVQSVELALDGDRAAIRAQACLLALDQLRTALGR
ncbi:MAG: nicotinamide-nucleotide amidohydrolase family protein [Marmoricola sp.]